MIVINPKFNLSFSSQQLNLTLAHLLTALVNFDFISFLF